MAAPGIIVERVLFVLSTSVKLFLAPELFLVRKKIPIMTLENPCAFSVIKDSTIIWHVLSECGPVTV